jgi:hypothetical protein
MSPPFEVLRALNGAQMRAFLVKARGYLSTAVRVLDSPRFNCRDGERRENGTLHVTALLKKGPKDTHLAENRRVTERKQESCLRAA